LNSLTWVVATLCAAATSPSAPPAPLTLSAIARGAVLEGDLGTYHRAVTTSSPQAQAFFDQGLRLAYGFNHDEAARSFAHAAELDPSCALCFWGVALVVGPNYNMPMLPDRVPAAWEALQRAQAASAGATPVERQLIAALAKRYPGPTALEPAQMQPFTQAYADAMTALAKQLPDDNDVQVLRAEALMDVSPWKLWGPDGRPAPGTLEIVSTLERVLARDPKHPGANHYYIHSVEASPHPERAEPAADRVAQLIPGAGHIVHMPAHIYQRVGRYADASQANRQAIRVDQAYMPRAPAWGYYGMYLVHNWGFLSLSASMQGRSAESLQAASEAAKDFPPEMLEMMPGMDFFVSEPLLAMVRFGRFDEILKLPRPPAKYPILTALWLHAQGLAKASQNRLEDARADLAALETMTASIPLEDSTGSNTTRDVVAIGALILDAAIAQKSGAGRAVDAWRLAVAAEDRLAYNEPSDWFYPVRHYLGAALLAAKRFPEAEATYREDLRRNPRNGWALWGLARALEGQGMAREAREIQKQFDTAWKDADIQLTTTAFL
jgi:tetratricopeptide (TPR) repeat protein